MAKIGLLGASVRRWLTKNGLSQYTQTIQVRLPRTYCILWPAILLWPEKSVNSGSRFFEFTNKVQQNLFQPEQARPRIESLRAAIDSASSEAPTTHTVLDLRKRTLRLRAAASSTTATNCVAIHSAQSAAARSRRCVCVSPAVIKVTMGLGVAGRGPSEHKATDILPNADLAVYQAKQNGRNRVCIYSEQH